VHLLATSVTPSRSSTRLGLHVAGLLGQSGIEVTIRVAELSRLL
jgi:hypothetical protein